MCALALGRGVLGGGDDEASRASEWGAAQFKSANRIYSREWFPWLCDLISFDVCITVITLAATQTTLMKS